MAAHFQQQVMSSSIFHTNLLDLKFKIGIRDTNDVFFRVRIGRGSDGRIEMRQFMSDPSCLTLVLLCRNYYKMNDCIAECVE